MIQATRRFGLAWIGFGAALAIHVLDEATHDFLGFYNPSVRAIRARLPFLPLPTFTFKVWLTLLILGIVLFLCVSPMAFRGVRWTRVAAVVLSVVVGAVNAAGHITVSIYYHRWMAGVYSSPLLLCAAIFLLMTALGKKTERADLGDGH